MKLLLMIGAIIMSQSILAKSLTVNVSNIDVSKGGNLIVFLFTESGFPKNHQQAITQSTQKVSHSKQQFVFQHDLQHFAVKVLHDENGDGKVTKNWTGIYPHDGLVFSNQQTLGMFGPPNFSQCKVIATETQTQSLSLKYP